MQESQHLKQALLLLSLKLRCFLKQWRLGCKKDAEWKDVLEVRGAGGVDLFKASMLLTCDWLFR